MRSLQLERPTGALYTHVAVPPYMSLLPDAKPLPVNILYQSGDGNSLQLEEALREGEISDDEMRILIYIANYWSSSSTI